MIRLFELRNEKGYSQRDIAKLLFISQGTYNNWENGKTEPSIDNLIKCSKIFGVSIDYIVGNDENGVLPDLPKELIAKKKEILNKIQDCVDELKTIL